MKKLKALLLSWRIKAIKRTVNELLNPSNQVTTLEVKEYLRIQFPLVTWNQDFISGTLRNNYIKWGLTFTDNGSFRTYSSKAKAIAKMKKKTIQIGKTYQILHKTIGWKTMTPYALVDGVYRFKTIDGKYKRYTASQIKSFKEV